MFSFALISRSLLVLAVLAVTGPWCCCTAAAMLPQSGHTPPIEDHGCCPSGDKTPTHAPHDGGNCDKGCSVTASMPDAAGQVAITVSDCESNPLEATATPNPVYTVDTVNAAVDRAEPPGHILFILRSLYAQNCLLTV